VESTEHGRELLRRLPDWKLIDAVPRSGPGHRQQGPNDPLAGLGQTIITLTAATKMPSLDTQVLIRATGGEWPLDLQGFPPVQVNQARTGIILIDCADDGDDSTRHDSRCRLREYVERGWSSAGAPAWLTPRT
jgi:hypothetical protein